MRGIVRVKCLVLQSEKKNVTSLCEFWLFVRLQVSKNGWNFVHRVNKKRYEHIMLSQIFSGKQQNFNVTNGKPVYCFLGGIRAIYFQVLYIYETIRCEATFFSPQTLSYCIYMGTLLNI